MSMSNCESNCEPRLRAALVLALKETDHALNCAMRMHFLGVQFIRGEKRRQREIEVRTKDAPACDCWRSIAQSALSTAGGGRKFRRISIDNQLE